MLSRRVNLDVEINQKNVTRDIEKDILSFNYTDNAKNEADTVSLSLKDDHKHWLNSWFPDKNDKLRCSIQTINWFKDNEQLLIPCGEFLLDLPSYNGFPRTITLGGVSNPLNTDFSEVKHNRNWRNITLKQIATDISKRAGLTLNFIVSDVTYSSKLQSEQTDAEFLVKLCEDENYSIKVLSNKLTIFNEQDFKDKPHVLEIKENDSSILKAYSFTRSVVESEFHAIEVSYLNPSDGKLYSYRYQETSKLPENPKILKINRKVNSINEAKKIAKNKFDSLKQNQTVSLTLVGMPNLHSTQNIKLSNFGKMSGIYYIDKLTQDVSGDFSTSIEGTFVRER